ncbi:glutamate racemase [Comamonas odontotermitis]|uniref:Glutamate racemase n=1 Tax=Comamonas odontotermitis TaxID=379895 RepID=A0ABR6RFD9_9BURK|nr:glutamate racemase [Comamonas odontotermitis]MBB6577734.1 glutamate racemase [Comamonas odontotermitis]
MPTPTSPIGVFDSGIGGLSVLQALREVLPGERFVYLADSGNAPYGERGDAFVQARSARITDWMRSQHDVKALVIACNTATAAAIDGLRDGNPGLPIIGVEPALKPAAQHSKTHKVGVIATHGTVGSARFAALQAAHSANTQFVVQACAGLARAIEDSTLPGISAPKNAAQIRALCTQYTNAMGAFGTEPDQIDTLVLGCTHYIFAADTLRSLVGPGIALIDTGTPVARRTYSLLHATGMLRKQSAGAAKEACHLFTTGDVSALRHAASQWLGLPATCARSAAID